MPELICHLFGDYVFQNHVMATRKTSSWLWASIHVAIYMLTFVIFLRPSLLAFAVMAGTHLIIDRFRLAKYWVAFWGIGCEGWATRKIRLHRRASLVQAFQFASVFEPEEREQIALDDSPEPKPTPDYLAVWLLIIVDNTLHLAINHIALTRLN